MVPKAVLMRSELVSLTTARPVNTAQPKTTVNSARPMTNRVNTVKDKNVNIAKPKAVVNAARLKVLLNAVKGNNVNVVKASACWGWKPKTKVIDHVSKDNSASIIQVSDGLGLQTKLIFLSNVQGNPQQDLQEKGKLMEDMLPLEVTPNEGKSQAELTDESHVLLKVPRKNIMYSVNLKNIIPKGGLTYLFAKATSNESKLWHKRLGHINFKTMNKLVKGNLVRGSGPNWLFEIDALIKSMNYKPIVVGNQSNGNAGTKACHDTGKARMETIPGKDYIPLPLWTADPPFSQSLKSSPDAGLKPLGNDENKVTEEP
ncbi:ribonuclease H-like domain-containing protein [Tanacetum coccineum]|uniref:Ribonuclease H-like domain-containing protein n=1 Tax=Tanacetum coccineum TaxID=301880 RepID=A0ABQ5HS88_9ASTR